MFNDINCFQYFLNRIWKLQSYPLHRLKIEPHIQMFIKIKDNNQYNARHQFIRTFGIECLEKIKRIQSNLNEIDWEIQISSFQKIVAKVKAVIESYQLIAHQMFDSCQSVKYDAFGQAILKMFLQLSSTIKWLIKSFLISNKKKNIHVQQPVKQNKEESQNQKFRSKEISRFVMKGVMQQLNSQQNQSLQQDEHCFLQKDFKHSKAKALQTNSSNLPFILQEAIDTLHKKSEYIQKFVALRQNYQNSYRYEQPLTSQFILQSELGVKNSLASQKFKQIFNKIVNMDFKNKKNKIDYSVQVDISVPTTQAERNKKTQQKTKIKSLTEQLEKQKLLNKELKDQVEIFQKKLAQSIKQIQQYEIYKKKMSIVSRLQRRVQKNYTKPESQQRIDIEKLRSKFKPEQNDTKQKQQMKEEKSEQKQKSSQEENGKNEQSYLKKITMMKKKSSVYLTKFSRQNIKVNDSGFNDTPIYQITPAYSLYFMNEKDSVINDSEKDCIDLRLQNGVYNLQISYTPIPVEQNKPTQKLLQSQKIMIINKLTNYFPHSHPVRKQRVSRPDSRRGSGFKDIKQKEKNLNDISIEEKNVNEDNMSIQKKLFHLGDQMNHHFQFEKYFKRKQIKKLQLTMDAINEFFLDENTAKNYQLLNLSQNYHQNRKIKLGRGKKLKMSVQVNSINSLFLSSEGFKQTKTLPSQNDSPCFAILGKHIYNQLIRLKKNQKQVCLKLILFLRYPYSSVQRPDELRQKLDERLQEINCHLKRIWSIHAKCKVDQKFDDSFSWCRHKVYIINLFGFQNSLLPDFGSD